MRNSRLIAAAAMGLLGPLGPLRAADIAQSATHQEQIRGEAQGLVSRLDDFVDEYSRNGLANGGDYETLKKVRAELGSLSEGEMEEVVALLRPPGPDGKPEVERLAQAYTGGKDIALRLKQILAAHERQLDLAAVAGEARQLADRQSANLSTAIDSKQLAAQDKTANGQAAVAASEQAQQGEQGAIAGEVKLIADKLGRLAAAGGDANYKDAMTRLEEAQPQAAAAADALGGGKVDDAMAAEKGVHAQLDEIARELTPATKQESIANAEATALAALSEEQRTMLNQTKRLAAGLKKLADAQTPEATDKAMLAAVKQGNSLLAKQLAADGITPASQPDEIRSTPEMQKYLETRAGALQREEETLRPQLAAQAATEAALAAKAQIIREDLQQTAKEAAIPMANALTQMNSAQNALAQDKGDQAAQNETDAANALDQAAKLAQQGAANQQQAESNAGPAQQLQQLQNGVHELTANETASLQKRDAEKTGMMAAAAAALQANMAGKAQALEQAAAEQGSQAAQPLQQAADAMQNAAQAMQNGGTPKAAEAAQQAAAQNLAEAAQQLAQQAAAAAQGKQELANLQRQMDSLDRVIQEQKQTATETDKAAQNLAKAKALARQQGNVRRDAENVRQAVNTGTPQAAKALDHADTAMADAAQKLDEGGGQDAKPPQQAALAALYKAQDALADRMQKLEKDAGQPQQAAQGLANAEAQLAKAQQEAAAARKAMASGQNANAGMRLAAGQLGQAARTLAQVGAHPEAMPQGAREAMRNAEQSLAGAAGSATGGEKQQAQSQAEQGQREMEAAQSALDQVQAGIAGLSPTSKEQGEDGQAAGQNAQSPAHASQGSQSATGKSSTGANEKSWADQAGAVQGAPQGDHGAAQFLGLPERDRAAARQSQSEKYPQEYGSMIEEYMRSLASDAGGK